ncbi:MAG TPA: UDP-N-acetylmuramoyl-L-alanyl-D-glutamate--2,6-diaminopimelate ligase, partial [Acidobacteria bacterium]|nr:UDP-N-acetylmuramoyl-L-alanyl-D-glutamate--2,6-diaminopimelate ligase [Acidobacteriota bacterium]
EAAGRPTGLFGTLSYRVAGRSVPAERTTPEATDLAPLLAELVAAGGHTAVMEVSSHAIVLERVAGLGFDIAVLTNLSRDHLDFHGDMERYFAVKRRLFDELLAPGGRRVLPAEDPRGQELLATPREADVTWGIERGDVSAAEVRMDLDGTRLTLRYGGHEAPLHLPLIGTHNLANALAAAAAALAAELPLEAVVRGLEGAEPLPGRLERVPVELPFPVFVDYAHTPDGLRAVLESLRAVTDRRIVLVFGAGGDRDRGKRAPMGEAAGRLAHTVIVTSDNPRSEDPAVIAAAVAEGVRRAGAEPTVELDRRRAIALALDVADRRSLVLVAGKGHESFQQIGPRRIPFSDAAVIRELAGGVPCV